MNVWLVGQAGIILEILGAGFIVYSLHETKKKMDAHASTANTIDGIGGAVVELIGVIGSQFTKEALGFAALGTGLIMQFIGGFAS